MKILFVTTNLPSPPNDGYRIRVNAFIKKLYRQHGVSLASFIHNEDDHSAVEDLRHLCEDVQIIPHRRVYTISKIISGIITRTPLPVLNYQNRQMSDVVSRIAKEEDIDIVQAEGLHVAQHCFGLAKTTILDLHNVESLRMKRYAQHVSNPLKRHYAHMTSMKWSAYEREVCRRSDICLTCSHEEASVVRQLTGRDNVTVINNGVDMAIGQNPAPSSTDVLLFVGWMNYHANIDGVIWFCEKILPEIRRRRPSAMLQIVGKNPSGSIRKLANPGIVEITGSVQDVEPLLKASAIVVVPLRIGSGTRLKILEAMAMAKPIVSTSIGCEGLAVTPGQDILVADQPEEFAQRVVDILENPSLGAELAQAGQRLIENEYQWDRILSRLEKVYESCLHG